MADYLLRPPERFKTQRLLLRPVVAVDAAAIFERWVQDPEVSRYQVWRPHQNIDETRTFVARCVACWQTSVAGAEPGMGIPANRAYPWMIEKPGYGPIGLIEMRIGGHMADLGYNIMRAEWGHGYAPEAARAVTDWALAQPSIYRVWATCDIDNRQSARVLEKLGMQCEGLLKRWIMHPNLSNEPRDSYIYGRTK